MPSAPSNLLFLTRLQQQMPPLSGSNNKENLQVTSLLSISTLPRLSMSDLEEVHVDEGGKFTPQKPTGPTPLDD